MIPIGSKPIIWHIMKFYQSFNINEFIILGGYKCNIIKNFFYNKKTILKKWFYFNIEGKMVVKFLIQVLKPKLEEDYLRQENSSKKINIFFLLMVMV